MFAVRRLASLATHLRSSSLVPAASAVPVNGSYPTKLGSFISTTAAPVDMAIKDLVDGAIKENDVLVFSKTYCPYCKRAKNILAEITSDMKVFELDDMDNGSAIQQYLRELTGQGTVPNIFIKQQHIGGCSDLQALSKAEIEKRIKA